jgi:hypothetical protein
MSTALQRALERRTARASRRGASAYARANAVREQPPHPVVLPTPQPDIRTQAVQIAARIMARKYS